MKVVTSKNSLLIGDVERGISLAPHPSDRDLLVNFALKEFDVYDWGGVVRNSVANSLYDSNVSSNDSDFLVDDVKNKITVPDLMSILKRYFNDVDVCRFGTPKIKFPDGFEMDVVPFTMKRPLEHNVSFGKNRTICEILSVCDFTTGAIAYDSKRKVLYSCGALQGISNREIDILFGDDSPEIMMARLVHQAIKLSFNLGPRALDFIKRNYSSSSDPEIIKYLKYKKLDSEIPSVIGCLQTISKQFNYGKNGETTSLASNQTYLSPVVSFGK